MLRLSRWRHRRSSWLTRSFTLVRRNSSPPSASLISIRSHKTRSRPILSTVRTPRRAPTDSIRRASSTGERAVDEPELDRSGQLARSLYDPPAIQASIVCARALLFSSPSVCAAPPASPPAPSVFLLLLGCDVVAILFFVFVPYFV